MGLLPLEFTDCLTNSPYFRENLHAHEKELERTSQSIKVLIKEVKELLAAAKLLSRAQRNLASSLKNFKLECIGSTQTDDEVVIAGALMEFSNLLNAIEDERDRMLDQSQAAFIDPIENFRKEYIGGAKERRKKYEKETAKFCQSQDRHLNLSTKKNENQLQEADAVLEVEQRLFSRASLEYILFLQEVQERKKFEFVETILSFMYGWLTFYHNGHEVAKDFKSFTTDLQKRLQKTRENFDATNAEAKQLMHRLLDNPLDSGSLNKMFTRQGYLYLMEKKALGTTWTKHYCQYQKENHKFTLIPFSQTTGKIAVPETFVLRECIRRMSESIDKRFCFDIVPEDRSSTFTFQALSEEDRKLWMDAMDGKEPMYNQMGKIKQEEYYLDEVGFSFVKQCIDAVELRGLEDEGLYRLVGVSSKVNKLAQMALDRRKSEKVNLDDAEDWEIKTITSALKNYFRNLPEPLMTFRFHSAFIDAAKLDSMEERIKEIQTLVHKLPKLNYCMLELLIAHLCKISKHSDKNLMTVSNLGVCFGPTLLRPEEETMAAIMDIKFGNIVLEILIEQYSKIFTGCVMNGDTKENLLKRSQKTNHINNGDPVAPQRRVKRDSFPSETGKTSGENSPRSTFTDNSMGQRVMLVQPSYVQRQSYHSVMSSSQKNYSSSSSNSQESIVRSGSVGNATQAQRTQRKPLVIYNPNWNDRDTSSSSSTESLNSPHHQLPHHSPSAMMKSSTSHHLAHGSPTVRTSVSHHQLASHASHHQLSSSGMLAASGALSHSGTNLSHHQTSPMSHSGTNLSHMASNPMSHSGTNLSHMSSNTTSHSGTNLSHHQTSPISHSGTNLSHMASNPLSHSGTNLSHHQTSAVYYQTSPLSYPQAGVVQYSSSPSQHRKPSSRGSPGHSPNRNRAAVVAEKPRRSSRGLDLVGHQRHGSTGSRDCFIGGVRQNSVYPASPASSSSSSSSIPLSGGRRVRTLYACVGENDHELSFEPNQIIYNVRQSREPGWLEGCLNGRTGLVPENYVECLP